MGAKQRESLMDVMVQITQGKVEMHLRNGNREMALQAVEYAFDQIHQAPPTSTPKKLADDVHLANTTLDMRTILALEREGITTVGDVRKTDVMKFISMERIGKELTTKILEACGVIVPDFLKTMNKHQLYLLGKSK
jgi:hypothetical protein